MTLAACGAEGGTPPTPEPLAVTEPRSAPPVPSAPPRTETQASAPPEREVERDVAPPVRIEIDEIGVSAPVIPLGLERDGTLEVPEDYAETGWYTSGPEPGEPGPAVIVGHVDDKSGPAVFYDLDKLEPGDEIVIRRRDGSSVRFAVQRLERHRKAAFPTRKVYGRNTDGPVLRLVTCSGDFDEASGHYTDNTIVFASRA